MAIVTRRFVTFVLDGLLLAGLLVTAYAAVSATAF
jgi:hypothetical protein